MKLKWLDGLHRLYSFIQNDQRYIVDIDEGQFFPIDEVVWSILELYPVSKLSSLLDSLKPRYSEQEIFEGLKKISQLAQMGYLFEEEASKPVEQNCNRRKRLFWILHFVYPNLPSQPASVAWSHYHLIRVLAQYVDIYLGIPKGAEDHIKLVENSVQKIPIYSDKSYSPLRYVMEEDYDGILALSKGYGDDLTFFYAPCPVLARVNSVMIDIERNINGILAKYGLLRKQDALIADASWVVEGYTQILGLDNKEGFEVIPDGIDEIGMPQWEGPRIKIGMRPDYVKTFLAEQFGWTELDSRPIIGLIFGVHIEDYFPIALQLSHCHPEWNFLIITEAPLSSVSQLPENLRFFGSFQLGEDPKAEVNYPAYKAGLQKTKNKITPSLDS